MTLGAAGMVGLVGCRYYQRRRELGIRLAIGASPLQLTRLLTSNLIGPIVLGACLAVPITVMLVIPALRGGPMNVDSTAWWPYVLAPVFVIGVALAVACVVFVASARLGPSALMASRDHGV
jgi:ABC-type antimicrobial peptide transport system permease subunit